jgi:hypothetical protein
MKTAYASGLFRQHFMGHANDNGQANDNDAFPGSLLNPDSALMKRCRQTGQSPEQVLMEALGMLTNPRLATIDGVCVSAVEPVKHLGAVTGIVMAENLPSSAPHGPTAQGSDINGSPKVG